MRDRKRVTYRQKSTTDPAQKLTLIDKFAAHLGQGDMVIIADDLYVNCYIGVKN